MGTTASSIHWGSSCSLRFSILSAGLIFVTDTVMDFGGPHPLGANSDIPPGCDNAIMLLLSVVNSAGTGLWCSRLRVLLCTGIVVEGDVRRGRFQGVS